ncbi:transposase [Acinetobacter sp. MD2]|uniref:transposase n=1 Tax=Acinetobacter sp. MD2 TaxID=2600066 RepID=UPI002D1EA16C|nr:transposase [Acinetobacter sp. MD2]
MQSLFKEVEIQKLVKKHQIWIVYLPRYSPNMNPIKKTCFVLKHKLGDIVSKDAETVQENTG